MTSKVITITVLLIAPLRNCIIEITPFFHGKGGPAACCTSELE